jgi:hypothetical protein
MKNSLYRTAAVALFGTVCACKGVSEDEFADEYAAAYCRAHADCDCDFPWTGEGVGYGECLRFLSEDLADGMADARGAGLEYQDQCGATMLAEMAFVSDCRAASGWNYEEAQISLERSCSVYAGSDGVGDKCEPAPEPGLGSSCAVDLECVASKCERRYARVGQSCVTHDDCLRSWCEDEECAALRGDGDKCKSAATCSPDLFCSRPNEKCEPRPGEGEACGFEFGAGWLNACTPDLQCTDDSNCEPFLGLGDDCVLSQECKPGASCTLGTCQPDTPNVCGRTLVDAD